MRKPLTRTLIKIMANGFYQEHNGLLLSLFVFIFINFFYTSVLNQSHLTHEQLLRNALKLVLTVVSEPLGVTVFFSICFIYSAKSWQYVAGRLKRADVQFLFYSSNALRWERQVQSWFITQLIISLPLLILGGYAMLVGFAFGHWIIPLLLPIYLTALIYYGAWTYTRLLNNTTTQPVRVTSLAWLSGWPKPLFSLFLYEIIVKKRVTYVITKLVSLVSIILLFSVLPDSHSDIRLLSIVSLCVALGHVVLLYQSNEFELFYMRFARNFPYGPWQLYGQQVAFCSLLVLPELLWCLMVGRFSVGLNGACLMLSATLFFRALLYWLGQQMYYYLRLLFGLFIFFLLVILFGFTGPLAFSSAVAAWLLAYRYRYKISE